MTRRHFFAPIVLIAPIVLPAIFGGCSSMPNYDARYGDAVRDARSEMILDPQASARDYDTPGLDGKAAKEAIKVYQDSFKAPPPVVNVINIGGAIGGQK
ncbi:MAG: hypothetical protein ACTHL1_03465 [Burkholderiaceae bacterium]